MGKGDWNGVGGVNLPSLLPTPIYKSRDRKHCFNIHKLYYKNHDVGSRINLFATIGLTIGSSRLIRGTDLDSLVVGVGIFGSDLGAYLFSC